MPAKKKTITPVMIEAVIDRSGSMGSVVADTIGGYNTWLEGQQALPGAATLTLTLFDHEHLTQPTVDLKDAKPLDGDTYVPRGSTALNDAIGRALGRLNAANPEKAILVVLTDGEENNSHEFNTEQIKTAIQAAQDKGWQVVYLSADVNAFAHAKAYGVNVANTVQFSHDAAGLTRAFSASSTMNADYRGTGNLAAAPADTDGGLSK